MIMVTIRLIIWSVMIIFGLTDDRDIDYDNDKNNHN